MRLILSILAVCLASAYSTPAAALDLGASIAGAEKLDALGKTQWRPTIAGGFRTPYGLQFHPSCLKHATAGGLKEADAIKGLITAVGTAVESVVSCQNRFPELKGYLGEWIAQLRRTVITCTAKKQAQIEAGAVEYGTMFDLSGGNFSYDKDLDDEAKRGMDVDLADWRSLPRMHKPTIVFPLETIQGAANYSQGGDSWFVATFVHEILHSTNANNLVDHNDVEKIGPGQKGACGKDVTTDRINVIATMCTGDTLHQGKTTRSIDPTETEIARRIDACGVKRGCENLFTSGYGGGILFQSWDDYETPSAGLKAEAAGTLCARIYDRSACLAKLATDGPHMTANNDELNGLATRLAARLDVVVPKNRDELTGPFLAAMPELSNKLAAARGSACFDAVFAPAGDGLSLRRPAAPEDDLFAPPDSLGARVGKLRTHMQAAMQAAPACRGSDGASTKAFVDQSVDWLNSAADSEAYKNLRRRSWGGTEDLSALNAPGNQAGNWTYGQLVGPSLYGQYRDALQRDHYQSPTFDCRAAGLSLASNPRDLMARLEAVGRNCRRQ